MAINMLKKGKVFSIIFLLVLIDQLTKFVFRDVDSIGNFIYLKSYRNTGSAFSLFSGVEYYNWFIIILSIIIFCICLYKYRDFVSNKYYLFSFIFFISGVICNFFDRLFLGYVRDFIGIKYFSIFNIADIYLSLAFIILIYYEIRGNQKI
ncbi:MAG: signal peptidase II [Nanoarchaeota archaeon]|nr:signal peptidase II [Nanoarchaeota archaeon]